MRNDGLNAECGIPNAEVEFQETKFGINEFWVLELGIIESKE